MNIIDTKLKDLYIIEPKVFKDSRGWFVESWSNQNLQKRGFIISSCRIITHSRVQREC